MNAASCEGQEVPTFGSASLKQGKAMPPLLTAQAARFTVMIKLISSFTTCHATARLLSSLLKL